MVEINEPESIQKLKLVLTATRLIEDCQTNLLITPEEREIYLKTLNDKAHKIIEDALAEFGG